MEGTTLIVNIYGYQEPHYDNIKIYSKNYDIKEKENYKTITCRVLYLDHEIVKEEALCNSTYSLKDDAKVRAEDKGTFRTMVDGTYIIEAEPETEPPTEETTQATDTTEESVGNTTNPTRKPDEDDQQQPTEDVSTELTESSE